MGILGLGAAAFLAALASRPAKAQETVEVAARAMADGATVTLVRDASGDGHLARREAGASATVSIRCERLEGAWGLWLADVDGDGRAEIVVALRKRARFDPAIENRLHVYALANDRCVPLWRGTRLAGRFDAIGVEAARGGDRLIAWERVGASSRRVARYRWADFGFAVDRVLWTGPSAPPARWRALLVSREGWQ